MAITLGTYSASEYIYKDIANGQYMVDRVKRAVSYDATRPANNTTIFAYRDWVFNSNTLPVIGCSLNFYDGNAFEGLPYGQIGDFGVPVRSETLILTEDIVNDAYGGVPILLQENPTWTSDYPIEFRNRYPDMGGYLYKTANSEYPMTGWYASSEKMKYDFQQFNPLTDPPPVGLMMEAKDPFDNLSSVEYDDFQLLPIKATDALGLETLAEYDYRVMQANKVTDVNSNITVFDFSPLGLLTATAVIGKGTQGDYKAATGTFYERYAPSVRMEYDFFAFMNEGNPVWVKTIQREQHYQDEENSPTILKVEYSDGFGRLLQTRAQAEDIIFGNQTFGTSGLSADQNAQNSSATGIERDENDPLNVVVSGWKIYNNKGKVVEQYEPFFDKGFDYVLPQLSTTGGTIAPQLGVKVKMYYDPLGRVIKTKNPDNSEQRVIYGIPNALNTPNNFAPTPWENYTYDANDLAPQTNPNNNTVPASHYYTPKSALMDALGRTIQTTEHKAHYNANTEEYENVVMRYLYDIRGNLLEVRDPYNRKVFEHIYDLRVPKKDTSAGSASGGEQQPLPPLWTKHIDSGESTVVLDVMGKVVESEDAKGARVLNSYDTLNRSIRIWANDKTGENTTLRQYLIYGDSAGLTNPENVNLKGKIYKHYDEAGLIETPEYDFKGNVLTNLRQCIADSELLSVFGSSIINCYRVDWTGLNTSILDTVTYETSMEYDAINRVTKMLYPEDVESERKEFIPVYNRAGALQSVKMNNIDYVKHIAYDAKGQRLLIAYGNGIMTRYLYHRLTFRLQRQCSEKYIQNDWTFTPQSGTTKQDYVYINDLIGNIVSINDKSPNCGVGGTNSLDRAFEYDPLYRLLQANGRENNPIVTPIWDDSYRSTDNSTTTAYTQNYEYDKVGNIQKLQHIGNNNFTRNFNYSSSNNKLNSIEIGMTNYAFEYDECGNQTQETTNRHFEWDSSDRLRSFCVQTGISEPSQYAQYLYDSTGNRVKKLIRTQGGDYESVTYIAGAFEYKTDGTDVQNLLHVMGDQSRIATVRLGGSFGDTTPAIKYNLEDHLGSSSILLETNGTLINKEEYYPFGETSFGSYAKKRYKFSGKERDEESGLYYYGARYYGAWTCRFISVDPLAGKYMYLSSYNYAGNNVISSIDINGLQGDKNIPDNKNVVPTQKLLNGIGETWNSIKNNTYIGKYSSKFTVMIDFKNLGEKIRGHAVGGYRIELNSSHFNEISDETVVLKTVVHEIIHTQLTRRFNSMITQNNSGQTIWKSNAQQMYPGIYDYAKRYGGEDNKTTPKNNSTRDWQHNWMADNAREDIKQAMKEHDNLSGINRTSDTYTSEQWYDAMSFAGLEGTNAWNKLSKSDPNIIFKIL
ncbi:MAG: RHS repeat-associated core domain-containing protein [Crocinitomicaceae bacterium]